MIKENCLRKSVEAFKSLIWTTAVIVSSCRRANIDKAHISSWLKQRHDWAPLPTSRLPFFTASNKHEIEIVAPLYGIIPYVAYKGI